MKVSIFSLGTTRSKRFKNIRLVRAGTLATTLIVFGSSVVAADFADDFSVDYVNPEVGVWRNYLTEESTVETSNNQLQLNLIHAEPNSGERAAFEVQTRQNPDYLSATGMFVGERPESGNARFEIFGEFFNRTIDGGPEPGERTDNVELEIELNLGSNPDDDYASYCIKYRDANGDSQPLLPSGEKCFGSSVQLSTDTEYSIAVGIDRLTDEIIINVLGDEIREPSPYPFFQQSEGQDVYWTRFRLRDGAASGEFALVDFRADDESVNLATAAAGYYKTDDWDDFTNDTDRSKEVVDGRLKMTASNDDPEGGNDAFLRFDQVSDHIEAEMMFSSESDLVFIEDSFAAVRIAGILYNDVSDNRDDGNTGNVWGGVLLFQNDDGALVAEYCLVRADTDDWSMSTDLIDGLEDNSCPVFDLQVDFDTTYKAAMTLDQEAKTVTFELGGERKVVNIETEIYNRDEWLRAQARIGRGATGTVVGYWDNLKSDPNVLTNEELNAPVTDGESGSSGSSSGGGSLDYLFFSLFALIGLRRISTS